MRKKAALGIMLTLLLIGTLTLAFDIKSVKAQGTIYVRADGSIDPPTAPITRQENTYYFTDNIYGGIVVEINDVYFDGAGYTLQNSGTDSYGFYLEGMNKLTIQNTKIQNYEGGSYDAGIQIIRSSFITISGNNFTKCGRGINLLGSSNSTISGNTFVDLEGTGIETDSWGILSSKNNTIAGNRIDGTYGAIWLNSLYDSFVSENYITNSGDGMALVSSANNSISGNNLDNGAWGFQLSSASDNTVSENNISHYSFAGVTLSASSFNLFSRNDIIDNRDCGIEISGSSENNFSANNVRNSNVGIHLSSSFNNRFYHNNFNNTVQVLSDGSNVWDDGYPSGGNYWSDYTDVDVYSGPSQDQPGSDCIWDHPYVIDPNNQDRYTFVYMWSAIDVNHDGVVNVLDAAAVSAHWYPGPPNGPLGFDVNYDINGDGSIDVLDAARVSAYWTGPPKGPLAP